MRYWVPHIVCKNDQYWVKVFDIVLFGWSYLQRDSTHLVNWCPYEFQTITGFKTEDEAVRAWFDMKDAWKKEKQTKKARCVRWL